MKKSYLLSCIAAATMFVVADNLSAMEVGGGAPCTSDRCARPTCLGC